MKRVSWKAPLCGYFKETTGKTWKFENFIVTMFFFTGKKRQASLKKTIH